MSFEGSHRSVKGGIKELSRGVSAHTWTCVITKLTIAIIVSACDIHVHSVVHVDGWLDGSGAELKV